MKLLLLKGLFVLGLVTRVHAATFSIPDLGVSFDAPDGFTELSSMEIALKYPPGRPPAFVAGNAERPTTIAYDLKTTPLPAESLQEVKSSLEAAFERAMPGLQWQQRKMVSLQGRQWIQLELVSQAIDTRIHSILLITSFRGRMLIFNFNSTREEFGKLEAALRQSMQTISLQ